MSAGLFPGGGTEGQRVRVGRVWRRVHLPFRSLLYWSRPSRERSQTPVPPSMGEFNEPVPETEARRVLVADDEPMIRKALQRVLEKRGHRVACAGDAATAVALIDEEPFDAVLADARMPGDGLSILRHLDEIGFEGTRVLMTGGLASEALDKDSGVHVLQKPFRFKAVIPLVEGKAS